MTPQAFPYRKFAVRLIVCAVWLAGGAGAIGQTVTNLWSFTTPFAILASPAVGADGTIYVGSYDRNLYAIPSADSNKWAFALPTNNLPRYTGIYSSPVIGPDGTIYFGGEDGYLYALDAGTGTNKWAFPIGDAVYSDPAIGPDGAIYIGSHSTSANALFALNPNGTQRWYYPSNGTLAAIFSDPVVAPGGTVYFGCDDQNLYALNRDGALRWKFPTGGALTASPALGSDGTVYIGATASHKLFAVNTNGTEKWQYLAAGNINSSAQWEQITQSISVRMTEIFTR